jgi:hypothetical protein
MNVKSIVLAYLQMAGFDGLLNDWGDCGCENADLMPCDCDSGLSRCQPAYKGPFHGDSEFGRGEWLMYATKEDVAAAEAEIAAQEACNAGD